MFECLLRIRARDGKPEGFEIAEVVGKSRSDKIENLARDRVGRKMGDIGHEQVGRRGLAVLRVEIPAAADGFVAVHQQSRAPAHLAVEIFHAQRFAPLAPAGEILA